MDEETGGAAPDGLPGAPRPVPSLSTPHGRNDQSDPIGASSHPEVTRGRDPVASGAPAVAPGSGLVAGTERETYARLLDRAHERGLLSAGEHRLRLAELADAGSVAEMRRIVTDLPALAGVHGTARRPPGRSDRRTTGLAAWPGTAAYRTPRRASAARSSSRPWAMLAVLIVVIMLVFALLVVYADHVVHQSHVESGSLGAASVLRVTPESLVV